MSLESDIGALVAFSGFPCVANEYNGCEESYFVFTTSTQGLFFADDLPVVEREAVSLHLHCPHSLNTVSLRKQDVYKRQPLYCSVFSVKDTTSF